MQALNIEAEYRKAYPDTLAMPVYTQLIMWADLKVQFDGWVKDDGEYYSREEWDSQYDEPDMDCHCGHPECGAC